MYIAEAQVSVGNLPSKSVVVAIDEPGDAEESNCLVGIVVQKSFRLMCDHEGLKCYPVGTPSAAVKTEKEMLQYVAATKFRVKHEDLLPISSLPSIREKSEEDHLLMLAEGANDKRVLSSDVYIPKGGWQPVRRRKVAA